MFDVHDNGIRYNPEWLKKVRQKKKEQRAAERSKRREDEVKERERMRAELEEKLRRKALKAEADKIARKARENDENRTIKQIISDVAEENGCTYRDILGASRLKKFVVARHKAMNEVRRLKPDLSASAIGRHFNRDHATVLSALGRLKRRK